MAKHQQLALEFIQNDQWQKAHDLIQTYHDQESCLIHGYLHWQEGDLSNADYWYHRAQQVRPSCSLQQEFARLKQLIDNAK